MNIILIGMPGSGKTTIGHHLQRRLGMQLLDADVVMAHEANRSIQAVVERSGLSALLALEEKVLLAFNGQNQILSTGGSAVYSSAAMAHLGCAGVKVYLDITLPTLLKRVRNESARGLAKRPGHSLARLYRERKTLFEVAADVTIDNNKYISAILIDEIIEKVERFSRDG